MTKHKSEDLYKLFKEGEDCDYDVHCEMRSNILLVSGDHWKRVNEKTHNRINSSKVLSDETKLKLTKNHLGAIQERHKSAVLALSPGVKPTPYNESDLQDIKDAEIADSVWQDIVQKQAIKEKTEKWVGSFLDIGEAWAETIFDPNAGTLRGYEQAVDHKGRPLFRAPDGTVTVLPYDLVTGQPFEPVEDEDKPIFSGQVKSEVVWPMNIVRQQGVETFEESPWIGVKAMMKLSDIKRLIPENAENREQILKKITETYETTFKVFDCSKGEYLEAKDQALIRKMYWKPCPEYPRGYYYFMLEEEVIVEGELPFGLFPLDYQINYHIPTSPRGRSLIKRLRPGQVQINFLASAQAYHQMVMGDDKIITQSGSIVTKGQKFDGIRHIIVNGAEPKIMAGRAGDQFDNSLQREIEDLYRIGNVDFENKSTASQDINVQIYQSMSQKAKHSPYAEKIELFLGKVAAKAIDLSKNVLDEHDMIKVAGKREYINIPEFKRMEDIGYSIKMRPINGDLETMMGRQLAITQTLQYAGSQIQPQLLGKLLKNMPFLNKDNMFSHLTIDEDVVTNDMLAMERGQPRPAKKNDKHEYMLEMLNHRMRKPDFEFLPQIVKDLYEQKLQSHQQFLQQNAQELKALQDRMIPATGPLVKVDMYQNVVNDQGQVTQKVQKMSFPMSALLDLAQKLQAQGQFMQVTQNLDVPTQISLLEGLQGPQQNQQPMGPQGAMPPQMVPPQMQQQGNAAMLPGGM